MTNFLRHGDARHTPVRSAALMVGTRMVNIAVGLLTIPVLIRYLGGDGFAAWAILLATGAAFALLEVGMGPTAVRFLSLPARDQNWNEGRRLLARVWILLGLTFGTGFLATLWFAAPFAAWLGLPGTRIFSAEASVYLVFGAAAARALLQSGTLVLFAARRFVAVSIVSLLQPLTSNIAAMLVAWQFGRLDLTLIAFWGAQLGVLGMTFLLTRPMSVPRFGPGTLDVARFRELFRYGLANQMEGWAQFINFQFDKFIVAGLVGLWAVAPYEVANRAVAALRSIPASGADTFLPTAMTRQADKEQTWTWYLASSRIAAYGVCVFMLAPMAIAPVFLYAWTGEMGYVGRWAFVALSIGAMASVLSLPAATLAQAEGRPNLQGRAAALAILVNVPLSLLLVVQWGLVGAAIGTAAAMLVSAVLLVAGVHRHFGRPVAATLRVLAGFWPLLLVGLCWGGLTYFLFSAWFAALDPAVRFSRVTRAYPGFVAIMVYAMCLISFAVVEIRRGALSVGERAWLASLINLKWLALVGGRGAKR
jgi:O-antigen/teichoic acid export membrane protein